MVQSVYIPRNTSTSRVLPSTQSGPGAAPANEQLAPPSTSLATKLYTAFILFLVLIGWMYRETLYLYISEDGLGYWLGITGFSMMVLILLYPLRKYVRGMRKWGNVNGFYTFHILMGTLGPVLILYHANFQVYSVNSSVAFYSMLFVAMSGFVGRFIYTHIHLGFNNQHLTLKELKKFCGISEGELDRERTIPATVRRHLHDFQHAELQNSTSFLKGLFRALFIRPWKSAWVKNRAIHDLKRDIRKRAKEEKWDRTFLRQCYIHDQEIIINFIYMVSKTASFRTFERLFALWHAVHIPCYILMILAAIYHIIAVHMY